MPNSDILNLDVLKELERKIRKIVPPKIKIIESDSVVDQFRFPRSKKKRIRKKWARAKVRNFRPSQKVLTYLDHKNNERVFIVHPSMAGQLRWELAQNIPILHPYTTSVTSKESPYLWARCERGLVHKDCS